LYNLYFPPRRRAGREAAPGELAAFCFPDRTEKTDRDRAATAVILLSPASEAADRYHENGQPVKDMMQNSSILGD